MRTTDMLNTANDSDNGSMWAHARDDIWGVYYPGVWDSNCRDYQRERPQVDVQFGMANAWDYFRINLGRRGIDNAGYTMVGRTHFGNNFAQAQWNGRNLTFGDGPSNAAPVVSLDIVGHEWTHGVVQYSARLINNMEAGAANESFGDIFGTMIKFHTPVSGKTPSYLYGQDMIPQFRRSLLNPPSINNGRDHYSNRLFPGYCTPNDGNDQCGIHENNGIMNKAFYLLAEGGVHPYSGLQVSGIGRDTAARIFYQGLTHGLTANSNLHDVAIATMNAAAYFAGPGFQFDYRYQSTKRAWLAVGVPENQIDEPWFFIERHYSDFLGRKPDQGGWTFWANKVTEGCAVSDQACIARNRLSVSQAFFTSSEYVKNNPALSTANRYSTDFNVEHIYNAAYVDQCYRRYLQRAPDTSYWVQWLDDRRPNNDGHYATIANAFLTSVEYRHRATCCGD